MPDMHSEETRSYNMSQIKGKNTTPELLVRKYLFSKGFRYRLNDSRYPGCPDILLPKYKTAIFINGCFWHVHEGCRYFVWPENNREYWNKKLMGNVERDKRAYQALTNMGWNVVVIWECELKKDKREATLVNLIDSIRNNSLFNTLVFIFDQTLIKFWKNNKDLIKSDVSERNLCGNLAFELRDEIRQSKFADYYVDIEYNRNNGKIKTLMDETMKIIPITCDVIVHSRGKIVNKDNLIAIEMKKSNQSKQEKEDDRIRLKALTKQSYNDIWSFDGHTLPEHVCGYTLGVYIEIDPMKFNAKIEYYYNGQYILLKNIK
jgi:DNA mismatch endonuclease (patch repair protein)